MINLIKRLIAYARYVLFRDERGEVRQMPEDELKRAVYKSNYDCFIDFFALMIEKYGSELNLSFENKDSPKTA